MYKYKVICLKNNEAIYQKEKILTEDELIQQKIYWEVDSFENLLKRWNEQPESKFTKLKWIYYL